MRESDLHLKNFASKQSESLWKKAGERQAMG